MSDQKSSGDKAVDAIACKAVEQCLQTMPLGTTRAPPEFSLCLTERRAVMLTELAALRAAAADPKP